VWCPDDGRWSALDGRSLYGWAKTVGFLYEAQLRAELTRRLGVAWTPVTHGIADIEGMPRKVMRAFSRRRQEIEMHMARLVASGRLGPYDLVVRGRGFAIGDEILATHNNYRVGVLNGTRGIITDIDHNDGELRINADGREVVLPRGYVAAGHVTHACSVTFHKAQGLTVGEAFVLADDTLDRERAYTGMSRGTHSNQLYITDPPDERADERHAPEPANDAVARARRQLGRTLAQSMAIDQLDPHPAPVPEPPGLGPDLGL
jgi:ATP-dependent exoDNAse (exonuclease V) alpha subunit